jgi:glucose-1-phosphatase
MAFIWLECESYISPFFLYFCTIMLVKNIIFDFGGVFYDVDYRRTIEALAMISTEGERLRAMKLDDILDMPEIYEKGLIDSYSFISDLRSQYSIQSPEHAIIEAWNAMLIGLKVDAISIAEQFANQFNIIILSNTNEIHFQKFKDECIDFFPKFQEVFFSHEIGLRKPDMEVFDFVCKRMKFSPDETIFIDDNTKNSSGAIMMGIKFMHFDSNMDLSGLLHSIRNITHKNLNYK